MKYFVFFLIPLSALFSCNTKPSPVQEKNNAIPITLKNDTNISSHEGALKTENITSDTTCVERVTEDFYVAPKNTGIFLLESGTYHSNEIHIELKNKKWYGLLEIGDDKFEIKKVNIEINLVHDPLTDNEDEKTGKEVIVQSEQESLILIGGYLNLKEGVISGKHWGGVIIKPRDTLMLQGDYFVFATGCFVGNNPDNEIYNYQIVVQKQDKKQVIADGMRFWGEGPNLIWSGDIDGDNISDLIYNLSDHYNVRYLVLYLSSYAKNKILEKVAVISSVGC